MKQNYLLPAIQRKLESEEKYISRRILGNPRITEINDITTQYVKRMGNLFMYNSLSSIYDVKFNQMMDYFLQDPSYIETNGYRAIQVNLPEYRDSEHGITKKEYLRYKVDEEGRMSRTRKRVLTKRASIQERLKELASYDKFGIELQRETTEKKQNNRQKRIRYVRVAGKPHIVQIIDLDTGKERYIDIRDSEHFEDLDLSNAMRVKKEEIEDLTPVEKIRIIERTSNSVYGEGIRTILGMQINLDLVSPDVEK